MLTALGLTAVLLSALVCEVDGDFLSRVEKVPWLDGQGKELPRVLRDAEGNVERLHLNGMQLTADDFAALSRLGSLRFLSLYRTNVTNADLGKLRELSRLEGLNLTNTEITDGAIDEIIKFDSLRSLCLGNVAVTPAAVARLKAHFRSQERSLSLGYTQRKRASGRRRRITWVASAQSILNLGVESLQFGSGVVDFELPVDSALPGVGLVSPDCDLGLQQG